MKLLGINKGATCAGKRLRHGGAAAYVDGRFFAIAEERATGTKYAGGYGTSVATLLSALSLDLGDFDEIGVSTCCEPEALALQQHELAGDRRLVSVNHHLSHASLAFYGSGFSRALVTVIDGGGNVIEGDGGFEVGDTWWTHPREQHSYYVATQQHGLELVDGDFCEPFAVGMAEMYRAFTYYLGWDSAVYSSRTMALAGHGRRGSIPAELFTLDDGHLYSHIRNNPPEPIGLVVELGHALNVDFGEPRQPGGEILQIHRDVAAFVQEQSEIALGRKLRRLKEELQVDALCIAGGFALNVVSNGRLLELFPGGVYVPSAPGDDGQCLGNVYSLIARQKRVRSIVPVITKSAAAFLGPENKANSHAVAAALAESDRKNYVVFETTDFSNLVANMLASGSIICLYQDRSEFGPRALGARCILADPRRADAVSRLNSLKSREWFMPFAPAILSERLKDWFQPNVDSPFMSFAVDATPRALRELPAIVNADGSARVQTLVPEDGNALRSILEKFADRTGIPVLLNTSFNLGGRPIVETVQQAIESFARMPVNALAIGRFVVVKALSPDLADLPLSSSITDLDLQVYANTDEDPVVVPVGKAWSMIRSLQTLTDSVVFVRTELPLYDQYLEWLREGRKVTTIRLRKGAVEIPFNTELPLYETPDFGPGDRSRPTEYVRVSALRYHRFGELSPTDAERDGFRSYDDMRRALVKIYPNISDEDWVTVYDISLLAKDS